MLYFVMKFPKNILVDKESVGYSLSSVCISPIFSPGTLYFQWPWRPLGNTESQTKISGKYKSTPRCVIHFICYSPTNQLAGILPAGKMFYDF